AGVQAAASYSLPNTPPPIAALAAGLGFTMACLFLVRFGVSLALKSPIIPWTLLLATISITFWLESWMSERNSIGAATEQGIGNYVTTGPPISHPSGSKRSGSRQKRVGSLAKGHNLP